MTTEPTAHTQTEPYVRAARIVHGDTGTRALADAWLQLLDEHLIELARTALGGRDKTVAETPRSYPQPPRNR